MKYVLHVGCGHMNLASMPPHFHNGEWEELRLDIDENVNPDIIGSLQDMSIIENGVIDAIYSSHNIEHVWSFEVPKVVGEFSRVLRNDGFALVLCPDVTSVAQSILDGYLNKPVYHSPAGPISALDILYGFHADIERGRHYMAHKTAFTGESLAQVFMDNGFAGVRVVRDRMFGLHGLAFKSDVSQELLDSMMPDVFPQTELWLEIVNAGCFRNR